ncbi:MAG: hypothetical protein EKE20_10500 [Candidatus Symbiopectobacterium sp. Dall1.0]|nr:hypothetical protein [Candidatus Symbiopectobacterium sp. Dall1.0]
MSSMDAAKASAASGTRRWRSVRRQPFPKVSRSDGITQIAWGRGEWAIAFPSSGACYASGRDKPHIFAHETLRKRSIKAPDALNADSQVTIHHQN